MTFQDPNALSPLWRKALGLDVGEEEQGAVGTPEALSPLWRSSLGLEPPVAPAQQGLPQMQPDSPFALPQPEGFGAPAGVAPVPQDPFAQQRIPEQPSIFGDAAMPFQPAAPPVDLAPRVDPAIGNASGQPFAMPQMQPNPSVEQGEGFQGLEVNTFDPMGGGYDDYTARQKGIQPDETGHMPSLDPETGQVLKGYNHPTFHKTVEAETELGNYIEKGDDGRLYSREGEESKTKKAREQALQDSIFQKVEPISEEQAVKLDAIKANVRQAYIQGIADDMNPMQKFAVELVDGIGNNPGMIGWMTSKLADDEQEQFISDLAAASTGNANKIGALLSYGGGTILEVLGTGAVFKMASGLAKARGLTKTASTLGKLGLNPGEALSRHGARTAAANVLREEASFLGADLLRFEEGKISGEDVARNFILGIGIGGGAEALGAGVTGIRGARAAAREGRLGQLTAAIEMPDGQIIKGQAGSPSHLQPNLLEAQVTDGTQVFLRDDGKVMSRLEGDEYLARQADAAEEVAEKAAPPKEEAPALEQKTLPRDMEPSGMQFEGPSMESTGMQFRRGPGVVDVEARATPTNTEPSGASFYDNEPVYPGTGGAPSGMKFRRGPGAGPADARTVPQGVEPGGMRFQGQPEPPAPKQVEPAAPKQVEPVAPIDTPREPVARGPDRRQVQAPPPGGVERRVNPVRRAAGKVAQKLADIADPAAKAEREADALTGLGGRKAWDQAKAAAEADPEMAIGAVDVRNLTGSNHFRGHEDSDEFLKLVANTMRNEFPDLSFRIGDKADEFAVIGHRSEVPEAMQRIKELVPDEDLGEGFVRGIDVGWGGTYKEADDMVTGSKATRTDPNFKTAGRPETAPPVQVRPTADAPEAPVRTTLDASDPPEELLDGAVGADLRPPEPKVAQVDPPPPARAPGISKNIPEFDAEDLADAQRELNRRRLSDFFERGDTEQGPSRVEDISPEGIRDLLDNPRAGVVDPKPAANMARRFANWALRPSGNVPRDRRFGQRTAPTPFGGAKAFEAGLTRQNRVQAGFSRILVNLQKAKAKVTKEFGAKAMKNPDQRVLDYERDITKYLEGTETDFDKLPGIPENMRDEIPKMRDHIDSAQEDAKAWGLDDEEYLEMIDSSKGKFLSRTYEIWETEGWLPDQKMRQTFVEEEMLANPEMTLDEAWGKANEIIAEAKADPSTPLKGPVVEKKSVLKLRKGFVPEGLRSEIHDAIPGVPNKEIDKLIDEFIFDGGDALAGKDFGIDPKLINRLEARVEIPAHVRALLGEQTDPFTRYAKTVQRLTQFAESSKFVKSITDIGEVQGWVRRDLKSPDIDAEDWVDITSRFPRSQKELTGKAYIQKDVADALDSALSTGRSNVLERMHGSMGGRFWLKLNSTVKTNVTARSFYGQIRNAVSAAITGADSGDYRFWKNLGKGVHVAGGNMPQRLGKGSAEMDELILEMIEEGVIGSSVHGKLLKELASGTGVSDDIGKLTFRPSAFQEASAGDKVFKTAMRTAGELAGPEGAAVDLFRAGDDIAKAAKYIEAKAQLTVAYDPKRLAKMGHEDLALTPAEIRREAALISQNTYFNYDRVSPGLKRLRAFPPLASFPSFPYEVMRTKFNSYALAAHQMKNPVTRTMGIQRMIGTTATMGMGAGLVQGGLMATNMTRAQLESMKRGLGEWEENATIVPISRNPDGTVEYMNFSYTDPNSIWTDVLRAAMQEASEGGSPLSIAWEAGKQAGEPFFSDDMVFGLVYNAWKGKDAFDNDIRTPEGMGLGMRSPVGETARILFRGLMPAYGKQVTDAMAAARGDIEGNRTRPTLGMETGLPGVPGVMRRRMYNPGSAVRNRTYGLTDDRTAIAQPFNRALEDPNKDYKVEDEYRAYQVRYGRVMSNLIQVVSDMRQGGMPDEEILEGLKVGGFSVAERDNAMKGFYVPRAFDEGYRQIAFNRKVQQTKDPRIKADMRRAYKANLKALLNHQNTQPSGRVYPNQSSGQ